MSEEVEGQAAKPKSRLKLVIVAAVGLLVLIGGGVGAGLALGLFGGDGDEVAAHDGAADDTGHGEDAAGASATGDHAGAPPGPPVFVDLPQMLVNLVVSDGRPRFLKLSLAVEVDDERTAERITSLAPRIVDSFQLYLRTLTPGELQGPGSMFRLKEDLHARIHQAIEPGRVRDVLFKEMLVQ